MGSCCSITNDSNSLYKYDSVELQKYNLKNTKKFYPDIENAYVISVYDGDTITIAAPVLNAKYNSIYRFSVRIYGIDCPELRTKNTDEKYVALKAKEFAQNVLLHKHVILKNVQYDKYGRILASVYINNENYSELLIKSKLAIEYFGKTKCPPENWREFYEDKTNKK